MCRVLCKCPGATLTARMQPSAGLCPKCRHGHPARLWRTTTHSGDPSHLSAPHQVLGDCGCAEHFPSLLPGFDESTKPNEPLSSWIWPGQSGVQGASDLWGPGYETHCWRAGHSLRNALGPSLLKTPREPGSPQHPARPGGLLFYGTVQLPATTPSNTDITVHQSSWGVLLHAAAHHNSPVRACLCVARAQGLLWRKPRWITARPGGRIRSQQATACIFVLFSAFYWGTLYTLQNSRLGFLVLFFFWGGGCGGGVVFMKNP